MLTVLRSPGPGELSPGCPQYLQVLLRSQCQKALKNSQEEEDRYQINIRKYGPVFQEKKGGTGEGEEKGKFQELLDC